MKRRTGSLRNSQKPLPTSRGFDRYYGLADVCSNFFNPGLKARPGEGPPGRKGKTRVRRWAIEDKVIMGYTSPDKKFYHTCLLYTSPSPRD